MRSIQTDSPVLARALEYAEEAKRQREKAQQEAGKTKNTAKEQPATRVFFSQESQIRLSEEKSHDIKQVEAARMASRVAAAEARSQAIRQEIQEGAEVRVENRKLREDRDRTARDKAYATAKQVAANHKRAEEVAATTKKIKADETARAIDAQTKQEKDLLARADAMVAARSIDNRIKEANAIADRNNQTTAVNNLAKNKKMNEDFLRQSKAEKATKEQSKAKADAADKMYQKVSRLA